MKIIYVLMNIRIHSQSDLNSRVVGWFSTLASAQYIIRENFLNLQEYYYTHAVIEAVPEGLFEAQRETWWYNLEDGLACERPFSYESVVNLTMG